MPNPVGRTFLKPDGNLLDDSHICVCRESVCLLGCRLSVEGFPFISQDADVTVCAQSALWMICRYFSNRYSIYAEAGPYQIGQLTTDYSIGRIFPSTGLTMWQMGEALRQIGFFPLIYNRRDYPGSFEFLLYTYIESGIPCLLGLPGHVIVGYGHESDFNQSPPADGEGRIHSASFNQSFVFSDDNCHPYQHLRRTPGGLAPDSEYDFASVDSFIAPLPEKVFLPAEGVRAAMKTILDIHQSQSPAFSGKPMVTRLFLTSVRAFKEKLLTRSMGHPTVRQVYRQLPMPHFIWVCEFSTPGDYPHHVQGELIWDATRNAHEPGGWIALHFPEFLHIDLGSSFNKPTQIEKFQLQDSEKYPIFTNNLKTFP